MSHYKPSARVSTSFAPNEIVALSSLCSALIEGRDVRVIARSPAVAKTAKRFRSLMAKLERAQSRQASWQPPADTANRRTVRLDTRAASAALDERVRAAVAAGACRRPDIVAAVGERMWRVRRSLDRLSARSVIDFRTHRGWRLVRDDLAPKLEEASP